MRIGIAQGTNSPPIPTDDELLVGDETVVLSISEARELLVDADDRRLYEAEIDHDFIGGAP